MIKQHIYMGCGITISIFILLISLLVRNNYGCSRFYISFINSFLTVVWKIVAILYEPQCIKSTGRCSQIAKSTDSAHYGIMFVMGIPMLVRQHIDMGPSIAISISILLISILVRNSYGCNWFHRCSLQPQFSHSRQTIHGFESTTSCRTIMSLWSFK